MLHAFTVRFDMTKKFIFFLIFRVNKALVKCSAARTALLFILRDSTQRKPGQRVGLDGN
jgi:hypothetical protein